MANVGHIHDPTTDFQPVKSAGRVLDVLELLAAAPGPQSLVELARQLGIPKSSLHGLVRTMLRRGWLAQDPAGGRVGLGVRALQVGAAYLDTDDAVGLVDSLLDSLAERFGETVHLGRLDGGTIVYLAKRESVHPLRLFSAIGRRLPAHATALGKALLAQHSDDVAVGLLSWPLPALTRRTITDRAALLRELAVIRERGHAVDHEENTEGIVCVAVAVPLRVPATDAISISVPATRLREETEQRLAAALAEAAAQVRASASLLAR